MSLSLSSLLEHWLSPLSSLSSSPLPPPSSLPPDAQRRPRRCRWWAC